MAHQLSLRQTEEAVKVCGVGDTMGRLTEEFLVKAGAMSATIRAVILPDRPHLPLLLGLSTASVLRLKIDLSGKDPVVSTILPCTPIHTLTHTLTANSDDRGDTSRVGNYMNVEAVIPSLPSMEEILANLRLKMDDSLQDKQKDELLEILRDHNEVWFNVPNGGGRCRVGAAQLQISGRPIRAKLRPMSEPIRQECTRQVQQLLEEGLIQPSRSPWASAPVFVPPSILVGYRPTCSRKKVYRRRGSQIRFLEYPVDE
eukprot:GHVS01043026.1.p2 GENE.GHVS01043026.1~~GHVS01043026.1.p2  ORF type:complete len:257 (+),score=16.83 GHVS01043026.1:971-1741(+)